MGQTSYGQGSQGGMGNQSFGQGNRDHGGQGGYASSNWGGGQGGGSFGGQSHGQRAQGSQGMYGQTGEQGWGRSGGQSWGQPGGQTGRHKGRGPKSYTRSDDRIREDVNDRLTDEPEIDATEIEVKVNGGEVTLSGTVDSREAKRRAEDVVEAISGVKHVQNNLRIQDSQGQSNEEEAPRSTRQGKGGGDTSRADKMQ